MNEKWVADEIMALKKQRVSSYTITVTQAANGTISPATGTYSAGSYVTENITASSGYQVASVIVDGASVGAVTSYSFSNLQANHTITATFSAITYSVSASVVGSGGTISASPTTVSPGGSSTITVTPASGYQVKTFTVNGTVVALSGTTYTITNIQSNQTVTVEFEQASTTVSYYIEVSNSTPSTRVQYSGCTQEEFRSFVDSVINPSVAKDGTLNYHLSKSNLNKKADGTTASVLTGADGDVMWSCKPVWWKVTLSSTQVTFELSDAAFTGSISAHTYSGEISQYVYLGMFNMPATAQSIGGGTATKACSVYSTTLKPWVSMTNDTARTTATARGAGYNSMCYLTWMLYAILATGYAGSTNVQAAIAQDYTGGSAVTYVSTSAMLTCSGTTGSTSSATTSAMYLFLANPWGNVLDWVAGLKGYGGSYAVCTDQYYARDVSISDASLPTTGWTTFTAPSTNVSGYITAIAGQNAYPLFPTASSGGSSSTYYSDSGYTSNSTGPYCGYVGGRYVDSAVAGVFNLNAGRDASTSNDAFGARLQLHDQVKA